MLDAVRREPTPTREQGLLRRLALTASGFAPTLVLLDTVHEGSERPLTYVAFVAGTWGLLAAFATRAALNPGRSVLGPPRAWLVASALAVPAFLVALALAAAARWPETNILDSDARAHATCFALTCLYALGPGIAFALVRRQSDPVHPRATGALIGAASGAWGATSMALLCDHTQPMHVLVGHVLPVVLLTLAGAALAARVVAIRP